MGKSDQAVNPFPRIYLALVAIWLVIFSWDAAFHLTSAEEVGKIEGHRYGKNPSAQVVLADGTKEYVRVPLLMAHPKRGDEIAIRRVGWPWVRLAWAGVFLYAPTIFVTSVLIPIAFCVFMLSRSYAPKEDN